MLLNTVDISIIFAFLLVSLIIGIIVMRKAGSSSEEYFAGGRNMPWWLLGVSMVATTFSTDTPNLVTDIVRKNGVSGNWVWFAFLITGMLTVFVYAKLWKRSNVLTDIEFYELRYSGKPATFLRGFRALYLGVFFNVLIMGTVSLAAIKIGTILLGISPETTIIVSGIVVVIYSMLGGLRGILITDFFQFFFAMFGAVAVAVVAVKKVGGLDKLLTNEKVMSKLSIFPDFSDVNLLMAVFIIPLAVQWWAAWYPGAEPGGGGYIVQRMIAAKDEKNSIGATLLFNIVHYAVRPWPWILVALASIIVFPDLQSISNAFSNIPADKLGHDLAYPAMISFLPHGLLGIVVASLTAAFMSTISTHLNWGSSYIVNDFYKRFVNKDASEKQMVRVGRISTLLLMIASGIFALYLQNAFQAFKILLQIGAGTGLLFILRWFWWRINAISEITAMVVSFFVAIYFELIHTRLGFEKFEDWQKFSLGVLITTVAWILATLLTKPSDKSVLIKFYKLINPSGPGWKNFAKRENIFKIEKDNGLANSLFSVFLGSICVYATLFSIGYWLYSNQTLGIITSVIAIASAFALWKNINGNKTK